MLTDLLRLPKHSVPVRRSGGPLPRQRCQHDPGYNRASSYDGGYAFSPASERKKTPGHCRRNRAAKASDADDESRSSSPHVRFEDFCRRDVEADRCRRYTGTRKHCRDDSERW